MRELAIQTRFSGLFLIWLLIVSAFVVRSVYDAISDVALFVEKQAEGKADGQTESTDGWTVAAALWDGQPISSLLIHTFFATGNFPIYGDIPARRGHPHTGPPGP